MVLQQRAQLVQGRASHSGGRPPGDGAGGGGSQRGGGLLGGLLRGWVRGSGSLHVGCSLERFKGEHLVTGLESYEIR